MKNIWAILALICLALFSSCQGTQWNDVEKQTHCSNEICNMEGSKVIQTFLHEEGFAYFEAGNNYFEAGNNLITEATRSFGNITQVINVRFDSLPMVSSVFTLSEGNNTKTRAEVREMKNLSAGDLWVWEGRPIFCFDECSQRVLVVVKRFDVNETVSADVISDAADEITAYVEIFREETALPLEQQPNSGNWYLPVDESEYS